MDPQQRIRFNALATYVRYHMADCTIKPQYMACKRLLGKRFDLDQAIDEYNSFVEEYALDMLPEGYHQTYDYWGGRCITNQPSGTRLTNYTFGGDSYRVFTIFTCFDALEEYTNEAVPFLESHGEVCAA